MTLYTYANADVDANVDADAELRNIVDLKVFRIVSASWSGYFDRLKNI